MSDFTGAAALIFATLAGGVQLALASRQVRVDSDHSKWLEWGFRRLSQGLFLLASGSLLLPAAFYFAVAKDQQPWVQQGAQQVVGFLMASGLILAALCVVPILTIVYGLFTTPTEPSDERRSDIEHAGTNREGSRRRINRVSSK